MTNIRSSFNELTPEKIEEGAGDIYALHAILFTFILTILSWVSFFLLAINGSVTFSQREVFVDTSATILLSLFTGMLFLSIFTAKSKYIRKKGSKMKRFQQAYIRRKLREHDEFYNTYTETREKLLEEKDKTRLEYEEKISELDERFERSYAFKAEAELLLGQYS